MKSLTSTSFAAIAAGFLAFSAPANATDLLDGLNDPAPQGTAVNWTGFFAGGQFGYGIASQRVTTLSTESFDAVPSQCYNLLEKSGEQVLDRDDDDPDDDGILSIIKSISFISTNNTEEGCNEAVFGPDGGEFGTVVHDEGYTQTTGFDPAVDAHDVTTKTVTDSSDSGLIGGFQLGFDKQMGRVVVGVFGDYNWSDINAKNNDWTVGGRIGFLVDPRMMVYGLAGYTQADYDEADYEGWTIGGGAEYAVTDNIFVGTKYTYTDLGEETTANTPTLNIVSERDEHKILMDLKIKINSF